MVNIDFTAVFFAVSFIVFMGLMQLLFFGPVSSKINQREGTITSNKEKTRSLIKEIEHKISQFKEDPEILAARSEANELISAAKSEASDARAKFVTETATNLKATKEKQISMLETERNQIIKNLEGPIKEITTLMVGKLVAGANIKLNEGVGV